MRPKNEHRSRVAQSVVKGGSENNSRYDLGQKKGVYILVRTKAIFIQARMYLVYLKLTAKISDKFLVLMTVESVGKTPHTTLMFCLFLICQEIWGKLTRITWGRQSS